jgi:DNA primase
MRKFGRAAFEENVGCSLPAFEYFYRDLCRNSDIGSVEGKMRVIDEIMPRLAKVPSSIERHLHIREISRVLGVEENLLLRKAGLQTRGPVSTPPLRNESRNKGAVGPEEMLLCLMAKYPEVSERVKEFGIQGLFREDFISLAEAIIAGASAGKPLDWPLILNVVSEEERRRLSALFVDDRHLDEIDVDKAFNQCLIALERAALKDMKALTRELAAAEPGSHRYSELLGEIDSLRSKKSQLS